MKKSESIAFHLSIGVAANVLAFYVTRWLGNTGFGGASLSLALQVLVWFVAVGVSLWCVDWLIRRADSWLRNRYFRQNRPLTLSIRAKQLRLAAQLLGMYSLDNVDHLRSYYNFNNEGFQRDYDSLASELRDRYNIILPDYSDPNAAAKALAKGDDALGKIDKQQQAKRLVRFLPSNLTIKRKN
ncbi:MAG: hypothetical protein OXG27_01135 [Chloroflexi bacterium]|nr:hypothetical protein [Chloroflexota bacterium]